MNEETLLILILLYFNSDLNHNIGLEVLYLPFVYLMWESIGMVQSYNI
jgi:hypothetical protein